MGLNPPVSQQISSTHQNITCFITSGEQLLNPQPRFNIDFFTWMGALKMFTNISLKIFFFKFRPKWTVLSLISKWFSRDKHYLFYTHRFSVSSLPLSLSPSPSILWLFASLIRSMPSILGLFASSILGLPLLLSIEKIGLTPEINSWIHPWFGVPKNVDAACGRQQFCFYGRQFMLLSNIFAISHFNHGPNEGVRRVATFETVGFLMKM